MERTANCLTKLDRMNKALRHEEPDRVPISDFFWGSFLARWRQDLGLPADIEGLGSQRDALIAALCAELPEGASWTEPEGGLQLWLELPEPLDSRELYADALRAGVLVSPGFQFHCDGRPSRGLRLSIGSVNEAEIAEGVRRLGRVIRERPLAGAPSGRGQIHI